MSFAFLKRKFFKYKLTLVFIGLALIGGLALFWPNLFASYFVLDQDAVQQGQIETIFKDLAQGQGYEQLNQIAPNLTDAFIGALLTEITKGQANPDPEFIEKAVDDLLAGNADDYTFLIDEFIKAATDEMRVSLAQISAQEININISSDYSVATIIEYLNKFEYILNKNFEGFRVENIFEALDGAAEKDNAAFFIDATARLSKSYGDLVSLEVPEIFAELHKQELTLLLESKFVFDAFSSLRNDPIKSVVALNAYLDLSEKKAALENEFNSLLNTLNQP
jgi:hypothetical protein